MQWRTSLVIPAAIKNIENSDVAGYSIFKTGI
jgi:hypothetical protein